MLAFIDESGDPGRKLDAGSSKFFVVAIVVFADNDTAAACDSAITTLRRDLGLPARFEFRYSRNRDHICHRFVETMGSHAFEAFVACVDKSTLDEGRLRKKNELYRWTVAAAAQIAGHALNDATVVIDRAGDRDFRNELAAYLRHVGGSQPRIRRLKTDLSNRNNLLRLADYVAGVAARTLAGDRRAIGLQAIVGSDGRVTIQRQT